MVAEILLRVPPVAAVKNVGVNGYVSEHEHGIHQPNVTNFFNLIIYFSKFYTTK